MGAQGKGRMRLSQSVAMQRVWCDATRAIFRDAKQYHLSHSEILARFTERVTESPDWKRVPAYVQAYVFGYRDACMASVWNSVVWLKSIDGQLLTTEEVEAMCKAENGLWPTPWARCDTDASCYVWRDANGQPIRDRRFT